MARSQNLSGSSLEDLSYVYARAWGVVHIYGTQKLVFVPFLLAPSVALCSSSTSKFGNVGLRRNRHRVQQNCWADTKLLPSGFQNRLFWLMAFRLWVGGHGRCQLSIFFACFWPGWIRTDHSILLWMSFGPCADLCCYRQRPQKRRFFLDPHPILWIGACHGESNS
jgi:hypothetical protein